MKKNNKCNSDSFGNLPATMGLVLTGKYVDLAELLIRIELELPTEAKLVYKRFSPGKIYLVAEGDDPKERRY